MCEDERTEAGVMRATLIETKSSGDGAVSLLRRLRGPWRNTVPCTKLTSGLLNSLSSVYHHAFSDNSVDPNR